MVSADEFRRLKAKCRDPLLAELCEHVARLAERVQQLETKHAGEHVQHKHPGGGSRIIAEEA
jgi:hypothetical protein